MLRLPWQPWRYFGFHGTFESVFSRMNFTDTPKTGMLYVKILNMYRILGSVREVPYN